MRCNPRVKTRAPLAAAAALVAAACTPDDTVPACGAGVLCAGFDAGRSDATMDRPASDLGLGRDGSAVRDAIPIRALASIAVEPATATLTVHDGTPATQTFTVVGTFNDGTHSTLSTGVWSLPNSLAATVDPNSGVVTAGGAAGAQLTLSVQVPGSGGAVMMATATVDVRVQRTVLGDHLVSDVVDDFTQPSVPDAARQPTLDYPLDGVVIPANLPPLDVQWEGGNAGDLYRVHLVKPHADVSGYVQHTGADFGFHWAVDATAWRALLESDPGEAMTVTVERWDAAMRQRILGAPVTVRVARAVLSGTIYYWDLSEGHLMRLDALTGARSLTVPNPPPKPPSTPPATNDGTRCIACHAVSRDGRYLSAELWGGGEQSVAIDLTSSSLAADPAPTVYGPRSDLRYLFSTFSPDSALLVINTGNSMALLDRATGAVVPDSGLPADHAAHPDWSPDGMSVAMVLNTNQGWAVDFTRGDVAVVPRTGTNSFGPPRIVHRGTTDPAPAPDALVADAHPTFSPDNRWIAFQHGTNSRGGNGAARYPGRLELTSVDAMPDAASTPLDHANGTGEPSAYWPNFSPFDAGGYYWLAFYSRRDYGNAQVGTRGTRRRQIWVTAVRHDPTSAGDPSEVAYWLPGQDAHVENMSAFWAPVACRMNGTVCGVSSECCSGLCQAGPGGGFVCMPPPPAMCHRDGATCSAAADCCNGLLCVGNVCARDPG